MSPSSICKWNGEKKGQILQYMIIWQRSRVPKKKVPDLIEMTSSYQDVHTWHRAQTLFPEQKIANSQIRHYVKANTSALCYREMDFAFFSPK